MGLNCVSILLGGRVLFAAIILYLLILLGHLFWRLRTHFIIAARIPYLTISTVLVIFYLPVYQIFLDFAICYFRYNIESAFALWFDSISHGISHLFVIHIYTYNTYKTTQGCSYLFAYLLIYRAFLVYHKWKLSNFRLRNLSNILASKYSFNDLLATEKKKFIFCNKRVQFSKKRTYICIQMMGAFLVLLKIVSHYYQEQIFLFTIFSKIPWVLLIIVGVGVMCYSCKIKENMLCIKETWMIICTMVVALLLSFGREVIGEFIITRIVFVLLSYVCTEKSD